MAGGSLFAMHRFHQSGPLRPADLFKYLQTSIIKETLRIGKITDHRLSLIAPDEALRYQDWIIPAGVSPDSPLLIPRSPLWFVKVNSRPLTDLTCRHASQ